MDCARTLGSLMVALSLCVLTAGATAAAFPSDQHGLRIDRTHIYLDEALREEKIVVTNTTDMPLSVLTAVDAYASAQRPPVVVWPDMAFLRPGEQAVVHVLLANPAGYDESLFILRFLGRQQSGKGLASRHQLALPLLVHPLSLPRNINPWPYLRFRVRPEGGLLVENLGPYVLPLSPMAEFVPEKRSFGLPKMILLPRESVLVRGVFPEAASNAVSITPTDLSGKVLPRIEIPLVRGS